MSDLWTWFIIIIVALNLFGALWLMLTNAAVPREELESGETTGHTWDGDLEELNNPLPGWWMGLFIITLLFGVIYLVVYPGLGSFPGLAGWSQAEQYRDQVEAVEESLGDIFAEYEGAEIATLLSDPEALALGANVYAANCVACHGSDGRGAPGFPDLTDDEWMWGGSPDRVLKSILDGRQGAMPALGGALGEDGVDQVIAYVQQLAGMEVDAGAASAGAKRFAMLCVACHGPEGEGNPMLGAPNLSDDVWLYGSDAESIRISLTQGRNGLMPAQRALIGETRARLVAAYVLSLSRDDD